MCFGYSREAGARPFAAYAVEGLEGLLAARGIEVGGAAEPGRGQGYERGGAFTVELHVRIQADGTLSLYRGLLLPPPRDYDGGSAGGAVAAGGTVSGGACSCVANLKKTESGCQ